jgi:hypothetical protein
VEPQHRLPPSRARHYGVLDAVPANNGVPNAVARCLHCAQPIAVVSLLVVPAAAHIATPAAADA